MLLFGLFPLARLGAPRALAALRGAALAYGTSRERHRARNTLLVAQVALALVLLVAAGLMIRTFQALRDVDPGIRAPAQVQVLRLGIPQRPASGVTVPRMQNEIEDRLAEVAGVESVGFSNRLPLIRSGPSGPFVFENAPDASPRETEFRNASPSFARTLGTPLVAGRHLEWADTYERRPAALVSQNLANERWGSAAAALGQRLRIAGPNPVWLEVVGVVGDIRHNGLEQPAPAVVYFPQNEANAQFASRVVFFFVRSERVGTPGFIGSSSGRSGRSIRRCRSAACNARRGLSALDGTHGAHARAARDYQRDGAHARPRRHLRRRELHAEPGGHTRSGYAWRSARNTAR